jgi:voltage-gated potassium channel
MDQTNATKPAGPEPADNVYELFILILTLFSLLMLAAYYLLPISQATKESLLWVDLLISLIFLADFLRSLRRAPDKWAYLKWGWLDFLGSIPLILPLHLARLWRLVRAWRILRKEGWSQVGEDLDQNRAKSAALLMALLVIIVLPTATVAVLGFESDVPEANIQSGNDALWWSIVTMSTVGYGDLYPSTAGGRLAALTLMTVGIGIYGVLTSYLAHFFLPQDSDDTASLDLAGIRAELDAVNERLNAIQATLSMGDRAPAPRKAGDGTKESSPQARSRAEHTDEVKR